MALQQRAGAKSTAPSTPGQGTKGPQTSD
jgi:hypothetical protein